MGIQKNITILLSAGLALVLLVSVCPDIPDPIDPRLASTTCGSDEKPHNTLATSVSPQLRKLAEYEHACNSAIVDHLMMFAAMPTTQADVAPLAIDMVNRLKTFAANDIRPLVVFEPNAEQPAIITDIRSDSYDPIITSYYEAIRSMGVTDQQMGTWVLFPEANTPTWHNTSPSDFAANVKKVASTQKRVFPDSRVSLLLDSHSYPSNDIAWDHGQRKSLLPYVTDIPTNLIDSFGLQGFPSVPPRNSTNKTNLLNPKDFLPATLASEAARQLNTQNVWLNTGTFKRTHANDMAAQVELTTDDRSRIADGILKQALYLKKSGFHVSVNLFAQDKSQIHEATDWSYWHADTVDTSPDTAVFTSLVRNLKLHDFDFSLYDTLP